MRVDATYRNDLRELNELNFARFDAKLEQRLAQYDARWERRIGELRAELIKWSVGLWVPVALALIGLYIKS